MQLVAGQCFQHRQHGSGLGLGSGQIHIAVVAALHFAGPGHSALKASHEAEGFHRQLQCLGGSQAAGEQIEAGAAAHGANVDHAVLKGAVTCIGGKQMLQRMGGTGGQVIAVIGPFHADVPCENIAVLTAQIHAAVQFGMVNTEACNAFHDLLLWLMPAGAARCRARSPQRSSGRHGCGW